MVVEVLRLSLVFIRLGQQMSVKMPITSAVHAVLYEGAT